jgi:hypothetical protein
MHFVITIDTEPDNQWADPTAAPKENLRAVPRFQALCERFGFAPTYLCTHDVVTSPAFAEVLLGSQKAGTAEIGAHLHPWATPPFDPYWDAPGRSSPYPSELPPTLFTRKLQTLTEALTVALGAPPRSYRAGRWGLSAAHVGPLLEYGYRVDCSVTPLLAWGDPGAREHGQDFTLAAPHPYVMAWGDPARPGVSGLLEVPVTIVHTNALMRRSPLLRGLYQRHRKKRLARVLNRLFRIAPQWFRPFSDMSLDRLKAVHRTARQLNLPVLQLMFHSSELMAGTSPHNPTAADAEQLYRRLEEIFDYLARQGVESVTLGAFAERYRASQAPAVLAPGS